MEEDNRLQTWLSQNIKPLSAERRKEMIDTIRTASSPGFDYFILVILSGSIATLGLINDSPAVIIGAMLVAPFMSPILGVGLGSITADTNLARNALSALVRGALLAILLSALLTLSNIYLPFVPSLLKRQEITTSPLPPQTEHRSIVQYALERPNSFISYFLYCSLTSPSLPPAFPLSQHRRELRA